LPTVSGPEGQLLQSRVSTDDARKNLEYLATFAGNLLAVLFNVYTQTLPSYRGPILQCINTYLSITPEKEVVETFTRVATMIESAIAEESKQNMTDKQQKKTANGASDNSMPAMSHTLMDLVITISIYLPRSSFTQLFAIASSLLKSDDQNLQKKAYKLIPRLGESDIGKIALQENSRYLQKLLLEVAETVSPGARKDRLAAIGQILKSLPGSELHFIPSVIPEVVISTKEQNEKARVMAFELLIAMGDRMKEGGMIQNSQVPHMPADSPAVEATLDEYVTMVSAGLAGTSPHSVSASVAAATRIFHEFHASLSESTVKEVVETMDIFIKNPSREIVRTVLGFIKCCVLDLPEAFMIPRLETIIPNLLSYEHEHKGALQAKVKHIFERMIRKYGFQTVEKYTPEQGRKLINNIRKTKERAKRKRHGGQGSLQSAEDPDAAASVAAAAKARKHRFGDAFDEALYGSDNDGDSESGSDASDDEVLGRAQARKGRRAQGGETYIVEDEDEPLDLLDRKALGRISSTRPIGKAAKGPQTKRKAKTDLDGKLVFEDDKKVQARDTEMKDALDPGLDHGDGSLESGINAYIAAIRGKDVAKRGQQGKLKFSNKRGQAGDNEGEDDFDEDEVADKLKELKMKGKRDGNVRGMPRGGGMRKARMQRRGLGAERSREKTQGGRVQKVRGGGGRGRATGRR
jgi:ribosomal RNA-processing protein 12